MELAGQSEELHVLFNNCCGDQAQRDAARMAELLGVGPVGRGGRRPARAGSSS